MLMDSVKLLDGVIEDGVIQSGNVLPVAQDVNAPKKKGQLFYLDIQVGDKAPGLYVFNGVDWVPSSGASSGGSGEGDETDSWMG